MGFEDGPWPLKRLDVAGYSAGSSGQPAMEPRRGQALSMAFGQEFPHRS